MNSALRRLIRAASLGKYNPVDGAAFAEREGDCWVEWDGKKPKFFVVEKMTKTDKGIELETALMEPSEKTPLYVGVAIAVVMAVVQVVTLILLLNK